MNQLSNAQSPYLLQHADNPVHWREWNADAFAQARQQDKPILLSIGYAACHWCHVMAAESFCDEATAEQMNADFINIKVDREERPDIDQIYQAAHYVFTRRSGGWPLTMFLTPAGEPFFGGTYFPKEQRQGLASFSHVMARVTTAWRDNRAAIIQQNKEVLPLLRRLDSYQSTAAELDEAPYARAVAEFNKLLDRDNGGLGDAPKFPHPVELAFCLDAAVRNKDETLLEGVRFALEKIAGGGLQDHLGGGFFRYCVDAHWHLPHFEKMLYDNGLLLALFADAQTVFADESLRQTVHSLVDWLLEEMRDEDGCFYASLDADSEHGEGDFYLWDKHNIKTLLTDEEYAHVASHYGLDAAPMVEGKLHLVRRQTVQQTAAALGRAAADAAETLATATAKLRQARHERRRPATDDKLLTAWNALAIRGLARAGRVCRQPSWQAAAQTAFHAIIRRLRIDGRTRAGARRGSVRPHSFLDDGAFLLDAALELLRADFSADTFAVAQSLATELQTHFADDAGGFFFVADDGEILIRRLKIIDDNATPSGNGVAVRALLLLSQLSGERNEHAEQSLHAFHDAMQRQPLGAVSMLTALRFERHPPTLVFLCGDADQCRQWQERLESAYRPDCLIYCLPPDTADLPAVLNKKATGDGVSAYICNGSSCLPPINDCTELEKQLATPSV